MKSYQGGNLPSPGAVGKFPHVIQTFLLDLTGRGKDVLYFFQIFAQLGILRDICKRHTRRGRRTPMTTLLDVLNAGHDQHVAIAAQSGLTLTYRQLRDEVTRAAEHLSFCGVRPGERVAMVYPNSAEAIV